MPESQRQNTSDGNADFSGGMDASRQPHLIEKNRYYRGCNVVIKRSGARLANRSGIHHQKIKGEPLAVNTYLNGNVQGAGWYYDGTEIVLIKVVDGYIIELRPTDNGFYATVLNRADPNNKYSPQAWVTTIPNGCIVNDGYKLPYYISRRYGNRRSRPDDNEIGVGQMGVYVQNRFFYVDEFGDTIKFSDFSNPISIQSSIDANLIGFRAPEDDDRITAIGQQKVQLDYIEGGVLAFATPKNFYSVDVRGEISSWEKQNTTLGKIQQTIPGLGATSANSFEPFNSNLYFRTPDFGLMSVRQSQYQFVQDDDFVGQTIEIDYWFNNDTSDLLDQCYTKSYKGRLYTTIAPQLTPDGNVYWAGMVTMNPDPTYGSEKLPRRFEGIVTGVRPRALTVTRGVNFDTAFYIDSYDSDGKNRLYRIVDNSDYDLNHRGQKIEIESWFETRAYDHGNFFVPKEPTYRAYGIQDIKRDVEVSIYSRPERQGSWERFHNVVHKTPPPNRSDKGCFTPLSISREFRNRVVCKQESENCNRAIGLAGKQYFIRQDRFEFKGPFTLNYWLRQANLQSLGMESICEESRPVKPLLLNNRKDFSYFLAESTK